MRRPSRVLLCRIKWLSLSLVAVAAGVMLVGCGGSSDAGHSSHYDELSSQISEIKSLAEIDSLIAANSKNDEALMLALHRKGKLLRADNRFVDAITAHTQGLDIAYRLCDTVNIVRALNELGTNFRRLGVLEEAASFHYQALAYCEQYSDTKSDIARKNRVVSLNGIGNIYMTVQNYAAADTIFRKALAGERALHSELGQAINLANLGSIKEANGDLDSAWVYYRESLKLNEDAGSVLGIALCHTHFGELLDKEGRHDAALDEYQQAYDLLQQGNDTWHQLEASLALARAYSGLGDMGRANQYLAQADTMAHAIASLEHQARVYELKFDIAKQQGNDRAALDYFMRADALADSVARVATTGQMMNVRVDYERQRRQAEVDLITKNLANEHRLKNVFIVVALLVALLATVALAFMLYSLRVRARTARLKDNVERMRTAFYTNITHEFRTPLTVMMGLSRELTFTREAPELDKLHRDAAVITRQGENLLQLINQLLDISKVRSAIGNPDWRHGDVVMYLKMIIEGYQLMASQQGVELACASEQEAIEMDFVPYYMRRIMSNLISNAIKFTPNNGNVMVSLAQNDDKLVIQVADSGVGIDAEDLPHIFDMFYRAKSSKVTLGTGVGLALVQQVVTAMDGTIEVDSHRNEGTVFTVTLPLKHGSEQWPEVDAQFGWSDAAYSPNYSVDVSEELDGETAILPQLLVVDDNLDVRYYIGSLLSRHYSLHFASDGREALEKAQNLVPDLIITDVMMPVMDGYELCRAVRQSPVLNHIPVVMVTALTTEADRVRGIEVGADAYLLKPFDANELRLLVLKLLEQRRLLRDKYETAEHDVDLETMPHVQTLPASKTVIDAERQRFLDRLERAVGEAMDRQKVDVECLASEMCMSTSQLRRKLQAITGQTTIAYVNQLRMTRALTLLREQPSLPVGEVAERCGYVDMAHFSRIFKQTFGYTPSQAKNR